MKENIESENSPIFSVLIVTRNEERYIGHLIEKLLEQDFPNDKYEIIVVDGMSTDKTSEIVQHYIEKTLDMIKLFVNKKKTLPPGWNIGILASKGDYVLRVDGHTEVPNDFLSNYWDIIKKKPEKLDV